MRARVLSKARRTVDCALTSAPVGWVSDGGPISLTVTFDPLALGARTTTVSIVSNDRFNPVIAFLFAGTRV